MARHNGDEWNNSPRPFLRWVGGKRRLARRLLEYLPADSEERTYKEPFLGAGSLYFAVKPKTAALSDANGHLISCYEWIRDAPALVGRYLAIHRANDSKQHYERERKQYIRGRDSAAQAARFIYLNATCFNGIFRVNRKGEFNVPYGRQENPQIPNRKSLDAISSSLEKADLSCSCYSDVLSEAKSSDFFYLDPPYPPLNGTSYFTHYTMDRFSQEDHARLAEHVRELDSRGASFLMTNADTEEIRKLYGKFRIRSLDVTRWVSCKAVRYQVSELVITNYNP